jgi:hypothetical protein
LELDLGKSVGYTRLPLTTCPSISSVIWLPGVLATRCLR